MVIRILILLIGLSARTVFSQGEYSLKNKVQMSGTISLGLMRDNVSNIYLHGFLNYFPDQKIALRGDLFYYLDAVSNNKPLKMNHQGFAGAVYYFNTGKIRPYLGFQPGVAISQRTDSVYTSGFELQPSDHTFTPLTGFVGGLTYFGGKYFSLFLETRWIRGLHLSNSWPKYLDELRLSFGLAFQFGCKK